MELLKRLTDANGISGNEINIREIIINELKDCEVSIYSDSIGNLIVKKSGNCKKRSIMFCAHMDEVGFVVKEVIKDGLLRVEPIGGIDLKFVHGKKVLVGQDNVEGVIWINELQQNYHKSQRERSKDVINNIFVYTNPNKKENLHVGEYVCFKNNYTKLGSNIIVSKALDDRAGCYIIINLLKRIQDTNIIACFTTQEELGLRGADKLKEDFDVDEAIIIDCTPVNTEGMSSQIELGKGPSITICDRLSIYCNRLYNDLTEVAKKMNIQLQIKKELTGATDAAAIQFGGKIKKVIPISIPCKYMHTCKTIINNSDLKCLEDLLYTYVITKNNKEY